MLWQPEHAKMSYNVATKNNTYSNQAIKDLGQRRCGYSNFAKILGNKICGYDVCGYTYSTLPENRRFQMPISPMLVS